MEDQAVELACTVDVQPGEKLTLPAALVEDVGPGRWIVTVRPCDGRAARRQKHRADSPAVRRHDAFPGGYTPQDEGLYDDLGG